MKATDGKRNKIFIWDGKKRDEREKLNVPHSILREIIMKQMWPVAHSEDDVYHHEFSLKHTKHTHTNRILHQSHHRHKEVLPMSEFIPLRNECVCKSMLRSILWCVFTAISEPLLWKFARKRPPYQKQMLDVSWECKVRVKGYEAIKHWNMEDHKLSFTIMKLNIMPYIINKFCSHLSW